MCIQETGNAHKTLIGEAVRKGTSGRPRNATMGGQHENRFWKNRGF